MANNRETLTLPLLITKSLVLFPGNTRVIEVGREFSINAVNAAKEISDSLILVVAQREPDNDSPTKENLLKAATLCRLITVNQRDGKLKTRVEAIDRNDILDITYDEKNNYYVCSSAIKEPFALTEEANNELMRELNSALEQSSSYVSHLPKTVLNVLAKARKVEEAFFALAAYFEGSIEVKEEMLATDDIYRLANLIFDFLETESEKEKIDSDINNSVRESTERSQKEYYLREKLKAIKRELGEDVSESGPDAILEKLDKFPYPENIKAKVKSELKKYEMMPQGALESALILSYLDVLMSLPWWQKTEDNNDLDNVSKVLDEDHYGLANPKKRIIEYLAVKKLTGNLKSPILCFYGPPGTGKTSLGKSIARALGRKFFKASLGGISDEAEIRGHRRTYVGSLPGRIIQGMRKVGVTNPVFLLDEVDKLASSYKGDPASALLEVLDPEQNTAFNDNYIEEPYDLSDVLFICTANYLENIPGPLRDRLELIPLSSYTEIEKVHIAEEHLVKKQTELNGLKESQVNFTDGAIKYIIRCYTRESGVRDLERKIASCLRKVAVAIVKDPSIKSIEIDEAKVREYLGVEIFEDSKKEAEPQIGVVTGLAYTEYGGDILPIEVTYFKGKGSLVLTGHLGDVMKESAAIALDYVKANATKYMIDPDLFANNDIHIHVPEGAVPKDGPSAGVAITCAIISCLSHRPVNPDVAMTGEVTLRGNVLPIGGLREKSLAALRSGIKTIIVPFENKKDVEELPKEVKESLQIIFMKKVDDAIKIILLDKND